MINLLTLIVIVMAVLTIWRLIRVMELVRDLRGEEEPVTAQDNNYNGKLAVIFMIVCFLGMIFFTIDAKKYLLPIAASKHGVLTDNYLYLNFGLISVVFFITQFLLTGIFGSIVTKKVRRHIFILSIINLNLSGLLFRQLF